ncbi:mechanosensitive ion channel family protein [Thalassobaculum sp. OXR-137]|uniref:mechanosensitive ion channel family protein n=1 Tax=Thalassobaculum sp. OXR-137 TaxID=3100173 RepID=UPI002AC92FC1|nr:mechanosensitive ion channel family protein [Thalassobaculum sp. OXR-137]WPZ34495.1 mechanosensitive ion channel family protein [Thalassobaculum sp. OXR-137]
MAPAHAQDGSATVSAPSDMPRAVAVEPVARDDAISRRIDSILRATDWYSDVRVRTSEGVVFLDGSTRTDEHRVWARNLAANTQDVVAVVNRITVTPQTDWSFEPALNEVRALLYTGLASLPLIALALVILPLAFYAATLVGRLVEWALRRQVSSPFLRSVIARTVSIPVFLIGLYIVLQVAGLTQLALSLLGGAGVVGIIVGFAFRDIAENFLASLLLSIRQPFRRGDYIVVGGQEGTVQSMNTRSTLLLSREGNHIQIPNAAVFKSTIVNFSAAAARQEYLEIGIGFDASITAAQELIRTVMVDHPAVLEEPEEPLVLVESLGSATVNLRAYFWFDGHAYSVLKIRSALLRLIKKALTEAGISMPDEAREVIFPQGVPVTMLDPSSGAGTASAAAETETKPSPAPLADESGASATTSEGDLENDTESLERHAADADIPEADQDLLAGGGRRL